MHPLTKFKEEQKALAAKIKQLKLWRKSSYLRDNPTPDELQLCWSEPTAVATSMAANSGLDFRIRHIAYCELRGRTREQIEPKVRDESFVKSYINPRVKRTKEQLQAEIEEFYSGKEESCAA